MKTNLQQLAEKYGVDPFAFGAALDPSTLELVLRASGVPERELQNALDLDASSAA